MGLGQIYFNLRGRECQGIVSSGAEYKALQDEIAAKLVLLQDPDTGEPVMRAVYKRDDIYNGDYLLLAPDLQVGFNDGYRVGWQDTLGGIQRAIVENNNRKWSGDHCATATEISGGVLFLNRKLRHVDAAHHGPGAHHPEGAERARARRPGRQASDVKASLPRCWRWPWWWREGFGSGRPHRIPNRPPAPRPPAPRPRRTATSACAASRSARTPWSATWRGCAAGRRACWARSSAWSWR